MRKIRSIFALSALAFACGVPAVANGVTYDFLWYSGARETWVYDAGRMLFVDVYEDPSTPDNDVLFTFRNEIHTYVGGDPTDLGYKSAILDLQIDTGSHAAMFSDFSVAGYSGNVTFPEHPVNDPHDLIDDSGPIARIAWSGDYAAGGLGNSADKTMGVNPGESVSLKGFLTGSYDFDDVIAAMNDGMSYTHVPIEDNSWFQTQTSYRAGYRAGASDGLRFAIMVHSIVPNEYDPDGHGLFVPRNTISAPIPEPRSWIMLLAGLAFLGIALRRPQIRQWTVRGLP